MKVGGSRFLKAADFPEPKLMVIEHVAEESVGMGDVKETKPVVYFVDTAPGIVCGPTVIGQLIEALGSDETDDWIGCPIVVYNDPSIQFQGRKVGGIRFRKPKGDHKRQQLAPRVPQNTNGKQDQDDLPF